MALVTTGEGRFFSNGLDLRAIELHPGCADEVSKLFTSLIRRIVTYPLVTVAAVNGHAFGGGCMFALAHDIRVMRRDRGWLCVPAVALGLRLPADVLRMARLKLTPLAASALLVGGRRIGGVEAYARYALVECACEEVDLLGHAVRWACTMLPSSPGPSSGSSCSASSRLALVDCKQQLYWPCEQQRSEDNESALPGARHSVQRFSADIRERMERMTAARL
jgi:enoyl-CoA hydratase/carnithine racemase